MDKKLKEIKQKLEEASTALVQLAEVWIALAELEGINEREPALHVPKKKKLAGVFPVGN